MNENQIFIDLRDIFSKLYSDVRSAKRIVSDAELDERYISFSDTTPIDFWHSILSEAQKKGQIDRLLDVALKEYETSQELRTVADDYKKVKHKRLLGSLNKKENILTRKSFAYTNNDDDRLSPFSPLLTGIIIDLSRSMIDLISNLPKQSDLSKDRLLDAFNILVEKAILVCRAPDLKEIPPSFALFLYGYGFSALRKNVIGLYKTLGFAFEGDTGISSTPVRDLFSEIASKHNLPITPDVATLNKYWNYYRESVESQFLDMGSGSSILYESLDQAYARFNVELANPFYKYPLLVIITDGQLDDSTDEELDTLVTNIKRLGVTIICCYIGPKIITNTKQLYATPNANWPTEAKRLLRCSSDFSQTNHASSSMLNYLDNNGWLRPKGAKLFIQLNNGSTLDELAEIILSPFADE